MSIGNEGSNDGSKRQLNVVGEDNGAKRQKLQERRDRRKRESSSTRAARLESEKVRVSNIRNRESDTMRVARLESDKVRVSKNRNEESSAIRAARLESDKVRVSKNRNEESSAMRAARLESVKQSVSKLRANRMQNNIETFENAINIFCDRICEVCTKRCYLNQVTVCHVNEVSGEYLPIELA